MTQSSKPIAYDIDGRPLQVGDLVCLEASYEELFEINADTQALKAFQFYPIRMIEEGSLGGVPGVCVNLMEGPCWVRPHKHVRKVESAEGSHAE